MKIRHLLYLSVFLLTISLYGQNIPAKPNPPRLVNDFTNTLSPNQVNELEKKLVAFDDTTSNQIAVVLVKSLDGYDKASYAYKIGEEWQVGRKQFNNGIVILIKPKTSNSKGQAFIATGYGLEGAIPDATAKLIVENEMIPEFKNNNYYAGIEKATSVLMQLASGEYSYKTYNEKHEPPAWIVFIPFLFVIILIIALSARNKSRYYSVGKRGSSLPFWTALWLGSSLGGGRSSGGSWNNFKSGGGSFGGGFGGFGGGSFGGGGAGGSW